MTLLNIPHNNGAQPSERESGSNREQLLGDTQIAEIDEERKRAPSNSLQQSITQQETGLRAHPEFGLQNHHHHQHHAARWHHQAQAAAFPHLPPSSTNKITNQARGSGNLSNIHNSQVSLTIFTYFHMIFFVKRNIKMNRFVDPNFMSKF